MIPKLLLPILLALPAAAQQSQQDPLRFTLILARHGVRSPTKPNTVLDRYATQPWPTWPVEPGELTPRGAQLLELFAAYTRQTDTLFPPDTCPTAIYLLADTDHRTVASARAFAHGFAPTCNLPIHVQQDSPDDPLFHYLATTQLTDSQRLTAQHALEQRLKTFSTASFHPALQTLHHILSPSPASPAIDFLTQPQAIKPGTGDHLAEFTGPLATASTLSENLLLEYADGMPPVDLGWGRLQPSDLPSLLNLHTAYFDLVHRTPAFARAEASNLLHRILLTLQQAATGTPIPGAIGPTGTRLVLLAGHDTNLASLAALLGLHWTVDGRTDDTPPGSQLAFELRQNPDTHALSVSIVYRAQTLAQLRQATPLTPQSPPATQLLTQPICTNRTQCPLTTFLPAATRTLDPAYLQTTFAESRSGIQ